MIVCRQAAQFLAQSGTQVFRLLASAVAGVSWVRAVKMFSTEEQLWSLTCPVEVPEYERIFGVGSDTVW